MKRIFSLLLILVICLSLCACEKVGEAGKYKTIGIFSDAEYTLKNNKSFSSSDSGKGTYEVDDSKTIWFSRKNEQGFSFVKFGDYYYKSDVYGGFTEDTSENLNPVMFNEKGRTDQAFYKGVETTYYGLDLNEDGTYTASIEYYNEDYSLKSKRNLKVNIN